MALGKGAVISKLVKQKKNTGRLTISELIGTHDMVPEVLWTKYSAKALGCKVDHNVVMQDNESENRLLANGIFSRGSKTKHIKVKYFLATDLIKRGEIEVEYCPSKLMWANVYNKHKQGKNFHLDRS